MRSENQKPYWLKAVFCWTVAVTAIVAAISLVMKAENKRIEREQDERDCDINECGC